MWRFEPNMAVSYWFLRGELGKSFFNCTVKSESTAALSLERECFSSLLFCSVHFTSASLSSPYDTLHTCYLFSSLSVKVSPCNTLLICEMSIILVSVFTVTKTCETLVSHKDQQCELWTSPCFLPLFINYHFTPLTINIFLHRGILWWWNPFSLEDKIMQFTLS